MVVAAVIGLALLAHACLALGLCSSLRPGPVLAVLASLVAVGATTRTAVVARVVDALPRHGRGALALAGFVTVAALFALALYPPTAFDETLYHLPYAAAFARTGGMPFLRELRFPIFPQLDEVLGASVLLFAGDVATHQVAVASTLLTAALVRVWGGPRAGALAAAAYLGSPLVVYLSGTGYVDPFHALFATAALYAAERWQRSGRLAWTALAGLFAGSAAATKYLGAVFVVVAAAWIVLTGPRAERRRAIVLYGGAALAALGPTYARIWAWTGNPVFPLLPSVFGPSPWTSFELLVDPLHQLVALPRLVWDLTVHRGAVARLPPISPVYLAATPLLAWAAVRRARVRRLALIAIAYVAVAPPQAHYVVAALPALGLALGDAIVVGVRVVGGAGRVPPLPRAAFTIVCVALLLPGWSYAGRLALRRGPVPIDAAARERYLGASVPAYAAIAALARGSDDASIAYAFGAEHLKYYARGTLLGELNGPYSYATVLAAGTDPAHLHATLRGFGATHLLLSIDQPVLRLPATVETARWFRRVYADAHAEVYALR